MAERVLLDIIKLMKVLTIGAASRDIVVSSDLFKIVHDPAHLEKLGFPTGEAQCFALGGKTEVGDLVLSVGGDAANAAVTFARQGFQASAFIKIGGDANGQAVFNDLVQEGVRPIFKPEKETKMDASVILLSPSGERTILVFRAISKSLAKKDLNATNFDFNAAYVAPGHIEFSLINEAISRLKKKNCFVAMNPSGFYLKMGAEKLRPILKNLDLIISNREEAATLTGKKYEDEKGIFKKFDELVHGLAVMTDGPKGVMVSDGKKIYRAGIYKEKRVADRTGAGDSFGSGFTAGILRKFSIGNFQFSSKGKRVNFNEEDIKYAIRLGSANATSNVEQVGAQTGILTRRQFETQARWKNLPVKTYKI